MLRSVGLFFVALTMSLFSQVTLAKATVDFTLPTAEGEVSLAQYRGKVVYLDFWASWCKPCVKSFPWMNEMQAKYGEDLVIIAVNLDSERDAASAFLNKVPANFIVAFDHQGKTAEQFKVAGMPSAYLISPQGTIMSSHIGFVPAKKSLYEKALQQAIKL